MHTQIYLGRAGSHSYGTSTPSSDLDFRGIFVADPEYIRTPFYQINVQKDPNEMDSESYELNKFMTLYCDGNPNIYRDWEKIGRASCRERVCLYV